MYGTTTYTAAITAIPDAHGASTRTLLLGFTIPFFGVTFAPIYTPHLRKIGTSASLPCQSPALQSLCGCHRCSPKHFNIAYLLLFSCYFRWLIFRPDRRDFRQSLVSLQDRNVLFLPNRCIILGSGFRWDFPTNTSVKTVLIYAVAGPIIGGFVFSAKGPA